VLHTLLSLSVIFTIAVCQPVHGQLFEQYLVIIQAAGKGFFVLDGMKIEFDMAAGHHPFGIPEDVGIILKGLQQLIGRQHQLIRPCHE